MRFAGRLGQGPQSSAGRHRTARKTRHSAPQGQNGRIQATGAGPQRAGTAERTGAGMLRQSRAQNGRHNTQLRAVEHMGSDARRLDAEACKLCEYRPHGTAALWAAYSDATEATGVATVACVAATAERTAAAFNAAAEACKQAAETAAAVWPRLDGTACAERRAWYLQAQAWGQLAEAAEQAAETARRHEQAAGRRGREPTKPGQ